MRPPGLFAVKTRQSAECVKRCDIFARLYHDFPSGLWYNGLVRKSLAERMSNMRKTLHWLWLLSGIALIASGILAICMPEATLLTLAWIIGFTMLFEGLCAIGMYLQIGWLVPGSGLYLLDGVVTTILALFILCNKVVTASVLPYLVCMWIIMIGVERILQSIDVKRMGDKYWWIVLILGILAVVLGILSFVYPIISAVTLSVAVGVFLILHGVSNIVLWISDHRAKRYFHHRFQDIPEVEAKDVSQDQTKRS